MRIIARKTLQAFWSDQRYRDSEQPLRAWYAIASRAEWSGPVEVKQHFRHASIVGGNRVVFNIAGNKYRLVVKFNYPMGIGFIRFVGTHRQYDRIDAETV